MQYPVPFTPFTPNTQRLTISTRVTTARSDYSLKAQHIYNDASWSLTWTWPPMRHAQAEQVAAWIASLRGPVGTFRYTPKQAIVSGLTGKTLALPAFSQNSTIRIAGWSAGEASQLRLGQFFSIGAQLFRIVAAPVSAAADGTCDVEFEPRIRTTVAQGAVVVFNAPVGLFRLIGTEDVGYTLGVDGADFGSMSAIEAVF